MEPRGMQRKRFPKADQSWKFRKRKANCVTRSSERKKSSRFAVIICFKLHLFWRVISGLRKASEKNVYPKLKTLNVYLIIRKTWMSPCSHLYSRLLLFIRLRATWRRQGEFIFAMFGVLVKWTSPPLLLSEGVRWTTYDEAKDNEKFAHE